MRTYSELISSKYGQKPHGDGQFIMSMDDHSSSMQIHMDDGRTTEECVWRKPSDKSWSRDVGIELKDYKHTPRFLQGNPFIKSGYRVHLSKKQCYRSLFVWSNESMNMWSHLVGLLIFFILMLHDNLVVVPGVQGSFSDHAVLTIGLLCFQFCMLCSTGYHMFRCGSERDDQVWLAYDLTGISIGLLGCYLPGVHYAFYCMSMWRDIYLIVISALFAAVLLCQTQPHYHTEAWFRQRIILYCSLAGYGVVPTIHWIYLNGGIHAQIVQTFAPKVAIVYMFGLMAFFFYITKCPEKCHPGRYDYVGSSHQMWHVIVVIAFCWWHQSGVELLQYRMDNTCPPPEPS